GPGGRAGCGQGGARRPGTSPDQPTGVRHTAPDRGGSVVAGPRATLTRPPRRLRAICWTHQLGTVYNLYPCTTSRTDRARADPRRGAGRDRQRRPGGGEGPPARPLRRPALGGARLPRVARPARALARVPRRGRRRARGRGAPAPEPEPRRGRVARRDVRAVPVLAAVQRGRA